MTPDGLVVLGTVTLPGTLRSVAYARSFLRDLLPPGDPALDDVVLVGSETVCNAITHTASGQPGGTVTVGLAGGCGVYRLEVADEGSGGARPLPRPGGGPEDGARPGTASGGRPETWPEDGAESGRGLRIVRALSLRWGFHEDGDRTIVWAEFPAPTAP
ncbi:ATP-binding protein [Actinomadura scrupuli]|uniref:ATP-binding protein n=1 Tax=Actinomadura scrupuli TaxID=559629 RepID=UPI003D978647